jgi:hypothetical protein
MSAFLRFTLFVAALCAAAVVGYAAGVRNSDRGPGSGDRLTIDTGQSSGSDAEQEAAPTGSAKQAVDATEHSANSADAAPAVGESAAPTSIDEILEKHASQPPPAE